MAPEHPPELVIFDSRFEDDKLMGDLYYVEVPVPNRLRVRWDAELEPENFRPVGGGVAYVFETEELQEVSVSHDSIPDDLGDLRYRWSEGLDKGIPWVMFVLILPSIHTLVAAEPMPARAKTFKDRLALYWILKADDFGRTQVECTLKAFKGSASSKLVELNRFCSGEGPPPDASVQIEDRLRSVPKRVFISYSQDSDEHRERVRGLHASLSRDGCDCQLDAYKDTGEDWPLWMTRQLEDSDFILCVITETYARRFRDKELPNVGLGVGWEAGLIRRLLYGKKLHNDRIFPVLFTSSDRNHIPLELQGYDYFLLGDAAGYEALLRKIVKLPQYTRPTIGTTPNLGSSITAPLFPRPGDASTFTRATQTKSVLPVSQPAQPTREGNPPRPRIYVSYTLRGEKAEERARKLADRLRKEGFDVHIDIYYRMGLYGFTAPRLQRSGEDAWTRWQMEQVRDADRVILICTPEYASSPADSGVARDLQFVREDVARPGAELSKFIPVGFGRYKQNKPYIPGFLQGANYFNLAPGNRFGGLSDLIRQLHNEFGTQGSTRSPQTSTLENTDENAAPAGRDVYQNIYHAPPQPEPTPQRGPALSLNVLTGEAAVEVARPDFFFDGAGSQIVVRPVIPPGKNYSVALLQCRLHFINGGNATAYNLSAETYGCFINEERPKAVLIDSAKSVGRTPSQQGKSLEFHAEREWDDRSGLHNMNVRRNILTILVEISFRLGSSEGPIHKNEPIWLTWTPSVRDRMTDATEADVAIAGPLIEELKSAADTSGRPVPQARPEAEMVQPEYEKNQILVALDELRELRDEGDRLLAPFHVKDSSDRATEEQIAGYTARVNSYLRRKELEMTPKDLKEFEQPWPEEDALMTKAQLFDAGMFKSDEEMNLFGRLWDRAERLKQLVDKLEKRETK